MIKRKVKSKIVWVGSLIMFIFIIIIEIATDLRFNAGGINGRLILLILGVLIIGLPMYFFDYSKRRELKISFNILACLIIVISTLLYVFLFSETEYFYFKSPDKKRTLVVEEVVGFRSSKCFFYENKYSIFIKPLNKTTDINEPYRPFTSKEYNIKWVDNTTVKIEYFSTHVYSGNIEISF